MELKKGKNENNSIKKTPLYIQIIYEGGIVEK